MKSILEGLTASVSELQTRFKRRLEPISSKLSRGLASLPDELLASICVLAASSQEGATQKHAVWLSHVSRRFRGVVTRERSLWTVLHSNASKEEVETIISRSGGDSDLHVVLHSLAEYRMDKFVSFLAECVPTAPRWATLKVVSNGRGDLDGTMRYLFVRFQLDLPRMREFLIEQGLPNLGAFGDLWEPVKFIPSWATPSIRSIRCIEYIPQRSSTYSSITSFTTLLSLVSDRYPAVLNELLAFLVSLPNIADLDLTVITSVDVFQPLQLNNILCPSITSLALKFPSFILSSESEAFLRPFIRSLHMPNLIILSAFIEFRFDDLVSVQTLGALSTLLFNLLPDRAVHSNLTTLNLEMAHTEQEDHCQPRLASGIPEYHTLVVPLGFMPYTSTVSLKVFMPVIFSRATRGDCALRKLQLRGSRWERLDVGNLERLLESLKGTGAWDTLDAVEVEEEGCSFRGEDIVGIDGAEKIHFKSKDV